MEDEKLMLDDWPIIDWGRKHCRCCPLCWDNPCDGVMQGGLCDMMACHCYEDECEYDD